MTKLKIISNPYSRQVKYQVWSETSGQWMDIKDDTSRSKLLEIEYENAFFPFKVWDIITTIKDEYGGGDTIQVEFEGTQNEYAQLVLACEDSAFKNDIVLARSNKFLNNADSIIKDIKEYFGIICPIVSDVMDNDMDVRKKLIKLQQAIDDVIPICVFGNYSAGKSSFINALIGAEILPCSAEPLTSKIYEISNSQNVNKANISFGLTELVIENDGLKVLKDGNGFADELLKIIKEEMIFGLENITRVIIKYINSYDKVKSNNQVVKIEYPFSKKGIFGESNNKFVIFDTPGSNAETNEEHAKVLEQAMHDFSNGISILVTNYDDYKSRDNANLCKELQKIDALDNRFTMVVFNKADSEYPEDEDNQDVILESESIKKMYSCGVFFVSSIMGLGSKNEGRFFGKRFTRTYKEKYHSFSDSNDKESFMPLYRYNIMPIHIKKEVVEYCEGCDNIVYSASGLYCVEQEIENFGSKYSAYNKCRMVYEFLNDIIAKTNEKITNEENILIEKLRNRKNEFDFKYKELEERLDKKADELESIYYKESIDSIFSYVSDNLTYKVDAKDLTSIDDSFRSKAFEEGKYIESKSKFVNARDILWSHLEENIQGLFSLNIVESLKIVLEDTKNAYNSKDELDIRKKELEESGSDQFIRFVIDMYSNDLDNSYDEISNRLNEEWERIENKYKDDMVSLICDSDNLTQNENKEMSEMIYNFDTSSFKAQAEKIFDKKRFLKGSFLGITLFAGARLDVDLVTRNYNNTINRTVKDMASKMNYECFEQFKIWENILTTEIKVMLTKLNSQLCQKADEIHNINKELNQLRMDRNRIDYAYKSVKDDIEWKSVEGDIEWE